MSIFQSVTEIVPLFVFEILKHRSLDRNGEIPALSRTERHPVHPHFPTMQVSVKIYRGIGKILVDEIISCRKTHLPLGGNVHVSPCGKGCGPVCLISCNAYDIRTQMTVTQSYRKTPRNGEIDIIWQYFVRVCKRAVSQFGRSIGILCGTLLVLSGLFAVKLPVQIESPLRVLSLKQFPFLVPQKTIGQPSERIQHIGGI